MIIIKIRSGAEFCYSWFNLGNTYKNSVMTDLNAIEQMEDFSHISDKSIIYVDKDRVTKDTLSSNTLRINNKTFLMSYMTSEEMIKAADISEYISKHKTSIPEIIIVERHNIVDDLVKQYKDDTAIHFITEIKNDLENKIKTLTNKNKSSKN